MKVGQVKWVSHLSELPNKGGVYYISSTKNVESTLYIGQSENLQKRLKGSHEALKKARVECSEVWIAYELVADEKERKLLEHLRIGELKPKYNDGGLKESKWKVLLYQDILELRNNNPSISDVELNLVFEWLDLVWENLDNAKGLSLLERDKHRGINSYLDAWNSGQLLLEIYKESGKLGFEHGIVGSCRGTDLFVIKGLDYSEWSHQILDSLLKIKQKRIRSWTDDK